MHAQVSWIIAALFLLQSCLVQSLPIIRPELPPDGHCCPVARDLLWSKIVLGLDSSASSLVAPLFDYRFLLPELQLRDGLGHLGTGVRLRSFVSDLIKGSRPLKVGVVGGSISWGEGAETHGKTDWFSVFMSWLASVAPGDASGRNGCVPGTTSNYMLLCLDHSVDPDVDLVFVDSRDGLVDKVILNGLVGGHEQLLRRLLDLPGRPAVVLVHVPYLRRTSFSPFPITSEDVLGALAAYYDLPAVSLRNALYPLNVHEPTANFLWNQTFADTHPGDAGHKTLADLAVHLIQETALGLVRYPISEREVLQRDEPLPPPMYEGNFPPPTPSCLKGPNLRDLMVSAEGWTWANEGSTTRPRWGFVATAPGSDLLLRLDTRNPHAGEGGVKVVWTVPVLLHYLKSYNTAMGSVLLRCEGGCSCTKHTLDGWHEEMVSQTSMALIHTSRMNNATTCDLGISVLEETRTEGHKFKISGVVVGVGYDLSGTYDHKYWRIPEEA
ncbi:hypothetical protein Vretifemale_17181 [Volvox reticuliferus]|uniref:SGNH hydrolase-type esterase domain-containing protein n=1 Tax=Volvox reticuliferus TaxID=1737510 RepID=A0A8J4FWX1_9CHLO|nr:hypothetical protein Vretifemale_17181 [Volvox reticuliferus]